MQKIELTKKVIIELFVIAGLFLVLLFFAVSQKVTIGQKYQQVYFNGELVGNIAGHVSVDDAVHEVRRELAAESDEPLCMDYEYSSSKANDWYTPLMTEDALKEIAARAINKNTGARALRSIIEDFMLDIMYEIPKDDNIGTVTVTKECIEKKGAPIIGFRG